MFLTPPSKKLYLQLQNLLGEVGNRTIAEPGMTRDESSAVRELASELRHQLAEDVGAAHPPRLRWGKVGRTTPPAWA